MVDQSPSYLFTKRNIYYYSRRIPPDMWAVYGKKRMVISLGTCSHNDALNLSHLLTKKLDAQWFSAVQTISMLDVLARKLEPQRLQPKLSQAGDAYLKLRGAGKSKTFQRATSRNINA